MKSKLITVLLLCFFTSLLFAQNAQPDEVVLRTNEKYSGEIVFHNEQILILKVEDGSRFQFPMGDIKTIRKNSKQIYPPEGENARSDNSRIRKITLKSSDVYYAEVLVENEQIVMIKTQEGNRFQFPANEVHSIETDFVEESKNNNVQITPIDDSNFLMMIDVQGGVSYSSQAYLWVPSVQGSLVLGAKDVFFQGSFLGGGVGYNMLFANDYSKETIAFLPVFVRLQSIVGKKNTAPYLEMDAGYGFSLNSNFGGGLMLKLSAGITHKLSYRTVLYVGTYAGLQGFSGELTQTNNFGTFSYYGTTTTQNIGAKAALRF